MSQSSSLNPYTLSGRSPLPSTTNQGLNSGASGMGLFRLSPASDICPARLPEQAVAQGRGGDPL